MPEQSGDSTTTIAALASLVSGVAGFATKVILDTFRRDNSREERMAKERSEADAKTEKMAEKMHDVSLKMVVAMTEGTVAINSLKVTMCKMNDMLEVLPCREFIVAAQDRSAANRQV